MTNHQIESLNKKIARAKQEQQYPSLWHQLAPKDLEENVQYTTRNECFRQEFILARFQTLTPQQLLAVCLVFPGHHAELLGKQLTCKNVGPWLEKFKYLCLLFETKTISHATWFYICAVKECETVDMPQTFDHVLPINLFVPQKLAQKGRKFITTQNLARVFTGGENFWKIAPQVGLDTSADSLLFYYEHQNVPNPLAPFLDAGGKFIDDANNVLLLTTWLNSRVNPSQEMPIELLNPDIFRHWWLNCPEIFARARFSCKWLTKYGDLVSVLEPNTVRYKKFLGESLRFSKTRDDHWKYICENQDLPEEFFYYFRDQNILQYATNCKTQFSPKLAQFWRLFDRDLFCKFKRNVLPELFAGLYSPVHFLFPGNKANFCWAKNSFDLGEQWYNETKWSKSHYKPIGSPDNTILQTLFDLSLQTFKMPTGGWPLEPKIYLEQVKLMLRFNNPVASIFTREFCKNNPQLVNYAIKWCTLSDECIYNIIDSFDSSIEQILNATFGEIYGDTPDLQYFIANKLVRRQTLPAAIVSKLVAKNIKSNDMRRELCKSQKFSNNDIDVWISRDPKITLELLLKFQDLSPENTCHLTRNYCNLIKEYKLAQHIKPQQFSRAEIAQIFDENSPQTRLWLKRAFSPNDIIFRREIETVKDVQTIAQFLLCRPQNLGEIDKFLDTASILRHLAWIPYENICDEAFEFDVQALVLLYNRTRFPSANYFLDFYRYYVTKILREYLDYADRIAQVLSWRFVFDAANFDETFLRQNCKLFELEDIFEFSNTISAEFVRDHIRSNKDVSVLVKNINYRKWLPKLQVLLPEFAWPIC